MAIYGGKGFSILGGYTLIHDDTELECPKGFIRVPGMSKFNTDPFCVAKYEMSYNETGLADVSGSDRNTRKYYSSKISVSMANRLPVTEITQGQAIAQCQKIGAHLITNNEWMTIAINVEAQGENWTSGVALNGKLFNGVSNDTSNGCAGKQDGSKWAGPTGSDCDGTNRNKLKLSNGMGNLYYANGNSNNIFHRGTDVSNDVNAGVFALYLNRNSNSSSRWFGFRCASF